MNKRFNNITAHSLHRCHKSLFVQYYLMGVACKRGSASCNNERKLEFGYKNFRSMNIAHWKKFFVAMALIIRPWTPTRVLQPIMNSQCFKSIVHSCYSNLLAEISLKKLSTCYQKRLCNSYSNDQIRTLGTFLGRASLLLPIDML